MSRKYLLVFIAALLLIPAYSLATEEALSHEQEITAYRERREAGLKKPGSWLTLVGLHWLEQGDNSVGSAADNDIVLTGGPDYWGTVHLDDKTLHFSAAGRGEIQNGGGSVRVGPLVVDTQGEPTVISSGSLSFYVIDRGSYALRVKDSEASALLAFDGLEYFPIDASWRIEADVHRAEPGAVVSIANVLGQLNDEELFATVSFNRDGKMYRLAALREKGSDSLFFIIADRTNSHESYGAGRFLYTQVPEGDKLIIDFNKVYNPPCAFNDYSTCPLPPPQNRLDLRVTAGELSFHVPGLKSYEAGSPDTGSR